MNTITLTKAEAILLHEILQNYHLELSSMLGQDMSASVDDEQDASTVAACASEFNYFTEDGDEIEVVTKEGEYDLFSVVNHFLERLETE